jgi:hypothetical protein
MRVIVYVGGADCRGIPAGTCPEKCLCGETFLGALGPLDPYCSNLEQDTYGCKCSLAPPDAWKDQRCVLCPRDTYRDRASYTACLKCNDPLLRSRAFNGNGVCSCNQGYYQDSDQMCSQCPHGSFKSSVSNSRICTLCPAGKTTAQQGATSADQCVCPPGTKSELTFDNGCALCDPGSENPMAAGNCSVCALGSVAAVRGTTRCSLCPAGFYAENTLRCHPCPFGTYTDRMGSSNCTPCAPNRFSRVNGSSSCGVCPAATFAEEGESLCHDCYNNVLRLRWLTIGPLANTVRGYFVMPLLLLAILVLGVVGLVLAARYRQILRVVQTSKKDAYIGILHQQAQRGAPAPPDLENAGSKDVHTGDVQAPTLTQMQAPTITQAPLPDRESVELAARLFGAWQHAHLQKSEKLALEQERSVHAPPQPGPTISTSVSVADTDDTDSSPLYGAPRHVLGQPFPGARVTIPSVLVTRPASVVSRGTSRGSASSLSPKRLSLSASESLAQQRLAAYCVECH